MERTSCSSSMQGIGEESLSTTSSPLRRFGLARLLARWCTTRAGAISRTWAVVDISSGCPWWRRPRPNWQGPTATFPLGLSGRRLPPSPASPPSASCCTCRWRHAGPELRLGTGRSPNAPRCCCVARHLQRRTRRISYWTTTSGTTSCGQSWFPSEKPGTSWAWVARSRDARRRRRKYWRWVCRHRMPTESWTFGKWTMALGRC
mmetsp:Transcript_48040/g.121091  ORF Transcript_48040/g.121091 Transcript_48040/m.121091 type:complete len:204 (+) Transcript_48040:1206-1817(+)